MELYGLLLVFLGVPEWMLLLITSTNLIMLYQTYYGQTDTRIRCVGSNVRGAYNICNMQSLSKEFHLVPEKIAFDAKLSHLTLNLFSVRNLVTEKIDLVSDLVPEIFDSQAVRSVS